MSVTHVKRHLRQVVTFLWTTQLNLKYWVIFEERALGKL